MQGIRANLQWIQEGENPTKYFLSLENLYFISKIMLKLFTKNNVKLSAQEDIINETKPFYQNLY